MIIFTFYIYITIVLFTFSILFSNIKYTFQKDVGEGFDLFIYETHLNID